MIIDSFTGKYFFLSNFYLIEVEFEGVIYPSTEHAYQAAKTLDIPYRYMIAKCLSPGKAKKLGQVVPIRPEWEAIKIPTMKYLLARKFENPELLSLLLATKPKTLIEGNYWGDRFWGKDLNGIGENWLGRLLMEIRDNEVH